MWPCILSLAMWRVATSFPAAGLITGKIVLASVAHAMYLLPTPHVLGTLAQRPGFNALYNFDCGNNSYSVLSMIHNEGLHAIKVGLIPYLLEILIDDIPKKNHHELDTLVKLLPSTLAMPV